MEEKVFEGTGLYQSQPLFPKRDGSWHPRPVRLKPKTEVPQDLPNMELVNFADRMKYLNKNLDVAKPFNEYMEKLKNYSIAYETGNDLREYLQEGAQGRITTNMDACYRKYDNSAQKWQKFIMNFNEENIQSSACKESLENYQQNANQLIKDFEEQLHQIQEEKYVSDDFKSAMKDCVKVITKYAKQYRNLLENYISWIEKSDLITLPKFWSLYQKMLLEDWKAAQEAFIKDINNLMSSLQNIHLQKPTQNADLDINFNFDENFFDEDDDGISEKFETMFVEDASEVVSLTGDEHFSESFHLSLRRTFQDLFRGIADIPLASETMTEMVQKYREYDIINEKVIQLQSILYRMLVSSVEQQENMENIEQQSQVLIEKLKDYIDLLASQGPVDYSKAGGDSNKTSKIDQKDKSNRLRTGCFTRLQKVIEKGVDLRQQTEGDILKQRIESHYNHLSQEWPSIQESLLTDIWKSACSHPDSPSPQVVEITPQMMSELQLFVPIRQIWDKSMDSIHQSGNSFFKDPKNFLAECKRGIDSLAKVIQKCLDYPRYDSYDDLSDEDFDMENDDLLSHQPTTLENSGGLAYFSENYLSSLKKIEKTLQEVFSRYIRLVETNISAVKRDERTQQGSEETMAITWSYLEEMLQRQWKTVQTSFVAYMREWHNKEYQKKLQDFVNMSQVWDLFISRSQTNTGNKHKDQCQMNFALGSPTQETPETLPGICGIESSKKCNLSIKSLSPDSHKNYYKPEILEKEYLLFRATDEHNKTVGNYTNRDEISEMCCDSGKNAQIDKHGEVILTYIFGSTEKHKIANKAFIANTENRAKFTACVSIFRVYDEISNKWEIFTKNLSKERYYYKGSTKFLADCQENARNLVVALDKLDAIHGSQDLLKQCKMLINGGTAYIADAPEESVSLTKYLPIYRKVLAEKMQELRTFLGRHTQRLVDSIRESFRQDDQEYHLKKEYLHQFLEKKYKELQKEESALRQETWEALNDDFYGYYAQALADFRKAVTSIIDFISTKEEFTHFESENDQLSPVREKRKSLYYFLRKNGLLDDNNQINKKKINAIRGSSLECLRKKYTEDGGILLASLESQFPGLMEEDTENSTQQSMGYEDFKEKFSGIDLPEHYEKRVRNAYDDLEAEDLRNKYYIKKYMKYIEKVRAYQKCREVYEKYFSGGGKSKELSTFDQLEREHFQTKDL